MNHQGGGDGTPPRTFGAALRRLRRTRDLSRDRLARKAAISVSYLAALESGHRRYLTWDVLDALLYHLDGITAVDVAERAHLMELAGFAYAQFPTPEQLSAEINPEMLDMLGSLEPNLAAVLDIRWNVLACNDSYRRSFPGVDAGDNLLLWYLANKNAPLVVPDWTEEVALAVYLMRGYLEEIGDTRWFHRDLAVFTEFAYFRELWDDGIGAYDRPNSVLRLYDMRARRVHTVAVQLLGIVEPTSNQLRTQFFLGLRPPMMALTLGDARTGDKL
ncbi:helix-turn-helix domain-containing protein [Nocardia tengchongensis]|uniref:MmyB family transcriptional regulator n=1 Tax=Nocardia tengchongensis TaxID=2055889 RepID=UPI0036A7581F